MVYNRGMLLIIATYAAIPGEERLEKPGMLDMASCNFFIGS